MFSRAGTMSVVLHPFLYTQISIWYQCRSFWKHLACGVGLLVVKSFSIYASVNVIVHLHFWKTSGGGIECYFDLPRPLYRLSPLKLLLHHLLTCTVSDEKSDIIFQYVACSSFGDFCSFNGFEQFNYVTRCGFLSVSRCVHLAPWIGGFIIFIMMGKFSVIVFSKLSLHPPSFHGIHYLFIRPFKVAPSLTDLNLQVSYGSVSIHWFSSSLWVMLSWLCARLTFFHWMPDIVMIYLLGNRFLTWLTAVWTPPLQGCDPGHGGPFHGARGQCSGLLTNDQVLRMDPGTLELFSLPSLPSVPLHLTCALFPRKPIGLRASLVSSWQRGSLCYSLAKMGPFGSCLGCSRAIDRVLWPWPANRSSKIQTRKWRDGKQAQEIILNGTELSLRLAWWPWSISLALLPELNRPVVTLGETTAIFIDAIKNWKEGEDTYPRKIDF